MDHHRLKSMLILFGLGIFVVGAAAAISGCGDDDGSDIACYYEERSTGCNDSVFGPWETSCADFPAWNYDNPTQACLNAYPPTDSHCEAGCCVSFEFRNVDPTPGTCAYY
jgi:hypothetical protein